MKKYSQEIIVATVGLILMNLVFVSEEFRGDTLNREIAGQFGDFVGGYIGTLFLLISVLLLFRTLKNQRLAGQEQNFETKYFELIKMHRDNVAELQLQETQGRKVFVLMLREFREILKITREVANLFDEIFTKNQLIHVAYYCLFFGTGPNSSRMLKISLASFNQEFISKLEEELNKPEIKNKAKADRKLGFVPFEGHQSRLGHYYRHLYQSICYVDNQTIDIDKYEYIKTIRAQLSTHEQAILLLNSLTPAGNNWWSKQLITKYRLVKNLPPEFFDKDIELDINKLFSQGYFEWNQV